MTDYMRKITEEFLEEITEVLSTLMADHIFKVRNESEHEKLP